MGFFAKKGNGGGTVVAGGTLGGGPPKPISLPVKDDTATHQTLADRLDWLSKKYSGRYEIQRGGKGPVVVRFRFSNDNSMVSGEGINTAAAVNDLFKKESIIRDLLKLGGGQ